ncbi:MAG: amino acid racemase [Terrisporobacter sp.]|uniref:aspartate/glutamate racemase family protein n=1 Tax=Terrisporobacter sp. TaxID=1965305 RepID=UPI002FC843B8
MKVVGIIGGMGPLATVDLFGKIVNLTNAKCDNNHIHILIDNNTSIPDRTSYILGNGENPIDELVKSAKRLKDMGADFLVMPCNTAHYFYDDIVKSVSTPFISMIEETANYIKNQKIKKVGLLSTTGTINAKVYDNIFNSYNIEVIKPSDENQNIIMDLIYGIKKGTKEFDIDKIKKVLDDLGSKNVECIILGCTELPVAFNILNLSGNYIDPTEVLAKAAIKKAIN